MFAKRASVATSRWSLKCWCRWLSEAATRAICPCWCTNARNTRAWLPRSAANSTSRSRALPITRDSSGSCKQRSKRSTASRIGASSTAETIDAGVCDSGVGAPSSPISKTSSPSIARSKRMYTPSNGCSGVAKVSYSNGTGSACTR